VFLWLFNWDLAVRRTARCAIVLSTFSKVVLHAQWRGSRARSPWLSVSFWELFLCAYAVKEKVGKKT
jgi:hypothetical protein